MLINQHIVPVFADTGADICVMSAATAKKIKLKLEKTKMKIRPYGSDPKSCVGQYVGTIRYGDKIVNTVIYVVKENVETLLSGEVCEALQIISFNEAEVRSVENEDLAPEVKELQEEFPGVFEGLGKLKGHKVHLHIDESVKPVKEPPRQVAFHLTSKRDKALEEMERAGVIVEHQGPTSWVSNLVLTPKDDGSTRVTLDFRNVNKAVRTNSLPIPRPENISSKLSGYKLFSKLDFKSAFYQLELSEEASKLTVFNAGDKLMKFKRMIMGCKTSSGELNRALRPIFKDIDHAFLIQDDLIVAGVDRKQHDKALKKVLKAVQDSGMTLNPSKCIIRKSSVPWWGMVVGEKGLSPDPAKVQAIKEMTPPANKEEVNSLVCLLQADGVGRDFIPRLAEKTHNIRKLLKKDAEFRWTNRCQKEFDTIKKEFKSSILLNHFDPKLSTRIEVDSSVHGLSAILSQGDGEDSRIVAVASRATTETEKRYPQIDLESMAIDYGLRRFRFYLAGGPKFEVLTDHQPLQSIFRNTRRGSVRAERIMLRHQDLDYTVTWKRGKDNRADYMSRHAVPWQKVPKEEREETGEFDKLVWYLQFDPFIEAITVERLIKETKEDPTLQALTKQIRKGYYDDRNTRLAKFKEVWDQLTIAEGGLILKQEKIILPGSMVKEVLEKAHQGGGHPGMTNLKRRIRSHFFWPSCNDDVKDFVSKCQECAMFTQKNRKPLLVPHDLSKYNAWERLSLDFFGPLRNRKSILVVQDMVSRFPAAKIMEKTDSKAVIAALEEIFSSYGIPLVSRTDNGPPFNSKEFEEYLVAKGIVHEKTHPYHQNANPVEAFMKSLGKAVKIADHQGRNMKEALNEFLAAYRASPNSATNVSPGDFLFRHGYGSEMPRVRIPQEDEIQKAQVEDQETRRERDEVENRTRTKVTAVKGDWVLTRNMNRRSKFDPIFGPELMQVLQTDSGGVICEDQYGRRQRRHMEDVKIVPEDIGTGSQRGRSQTVET